MPMPLDKLLRIRVHDQLVLAYQQRNLQAASQLCLCLDEHNNGSLTQICKQPVNYVYVLMSMIMGLSSLG